ncbi:MAG: glycine zipper 2TM domain-containing protein [Succinivibrionaceae bacterium]|nr:glycine zipper 2TM domain-containing protein [Succinivibrionaceae bacterium]
MKGLHTLTPALLAVALFAAGCQNPTHTAGQQSYVTNGTITNIEDIEVAADKYDGDTNTMLGAIVGAVAGQLIGHNTAGTLIGGAAGGAIGGLSSTAGNRNNAGLRLTVVDENGASSVVDTLFSCDYKVGQNIRVINSGGKVEIQVQTSGEKFRTVQGSTKRTTCSTY